MIEKQDRIVASSGERLRTEIPVRASTLESGRRLLSHKARLVHVPAEVPTETPTIEVWIDVDLGVFGDDTITVEIPADTLRQFAGLALSPLTPEPAVQVLAESVPWLGPDAARGLLGHLAAHGWVVTRA